MAVSGVDYLRIWADDDGETHLEEVTLDRVVQPPERGVAELWVSPGVDVDRLQVLDVHALDQEPAPHHAPRRQFVVFLDSIADLEPSTDSSLAAARAFDVLFTVVRHGLDDERFRPGDAAVIAQEVWAACHGSVALELLGMCEFADARTTYDSLLITILRGLLVDPAESEALV